MRLFGKKKPRKQQQQQQQSVEFDTHTEVNTTTARIITPTKEVVSRNDRPSILSNNSPTKARSRSRSSSRSSSRRSSFDQQQPKAVLAPTNNSNRSIGSRTPSFKNKSISPKASKAKAAAAAVVEKSPTSILHKDTHFGTFPTPSATTYDMTDSYNPRVRFLSSGEASLASTSESSAVHMMAGGNGSVASSSAMSSSGVLNKVMEEEYRRLN
eukprot:CAMPEP_0201672422 /NCGR_PEP_ID=MMETSP0494-20130426/32177_1 /ASSEMBLY_ACC=CAM_ASM_000839 /TAXON_ID=420259 /ORGANISM="Thalassiosira gravida, Strain GMp14c1" /LENGTH=211 /DNA_ID=CAMNT_0048154049 /DNA_START=84 /DNA_END=716 /DNA_ORIENTATION=+